MPHKNQYLLSFVFIILLLPILSFNPIQLVVADETEETDGFTQMPNYRWNNQTITDANIQEQLNGDYYDVLNSNNDSGSQDFAKSRSLNSRDLYFNSRFMTETGGDQLEFFGDQIGDRADFYEGDTEGWKLEYTDYITNGDFQTDDAERKYYNETEENTLTGWEYSTGYAIGDAEGWLVADGDNKYMVDYSVVATTNQFYINSTELTIDESLDYQLTTSIRTDWASGVANVVRNGIQFRFLDSEGATLGNAAFYIAHGWSPSNTSAIVYYMLDDVAQGFDSGWIDNDLDLYDVFDDIPDLDSAAERADIAYLSIFCFSINDAGAAIDLEFYYDDIQITSTVVGLLSVSDSILSFDNQMVYDINANYSTYDLLEFSARASATTTLNWTLDNDDDVSNYTVITTDWITYSIDVNYNLSNQQPSVYWYCEIMNASRIVYIDWITLWGDMDYNNTIGEFTEGEDAIPEVPGYWVNSTGEFSYEFTTNGDFEDDAVDDYYFNAQENNGGITGWDYYSGFDGDGIPSVHHIGSIETGAPDGSQMFQHSKLKDSGVVSNILDNEDFRTGTRMAFDWVEGDSYYFNVSYRFQDDPNTDAPDDTDHWGAFYVTFYDGLDYVCRIWIEWRNYDTTHANSSTQIYLYNQIAYDGDSGWMDYNVNITEMFDLMTAADTQAEREAIDGIAMQYTDKGTGGSATNRWLTQADNVIVYNMTADSDVWTPAVPEIPAVPGYWNYTYDTNDFSEWEVSSQFKYSLLNADDEEGLSIGFNRFNYTTNNYYLNISIYDSIGVYDTYTTTFIYDYQVDGWLLLDFEFDLDKKEIQFTLEYENGTDIFKTRAFTDIFSNIGTHQLLLFEEGFPQLCLNASTNPYERVWFLMDYIDANYDIVEFRKPTTSNYLTSALDITKAVYSQDITNFTADSPYGITSLNQSLHNERWYRLDVDKFDALSFDMELWEVGMDGQDEYVFAFEIFVINDNGTAERLYTFEQIGQLDTGVTGDAYLRGYKREEGTTIDLGKCENQVDGSHSTASYSVYRETNSKVIIGSSFTGIDGNEFTHEVTVESLDGYTFSKEFMFTFNYYIDNDKIDSADDHSVLKMGGFDLVRKDFLSDIAGAILDPIVGALALVFAPFFAIINFIGFLLNKGFQLVVDLLKPVIETLQGVMTVAFGVLSTAIETVIGTLQTAIETVIGTLETVLEAAIILVTEAVEGLWTALILVIEDIIDAVILLADIVVEFLSAVFFFIWDALGLPNLLAIVDMLLESIVFVVSGIPQLITDLTGFLFEIGAIALVIWWIWCALLPAVSMMPTEAIGEMLDRFMKPAFPWDIFGIHFYFPQGFVVVGLTFFLIIVPAGFVLW